MSQTINQLGTILNKKEQQHIKGGGYYYTVKNRGETRCFYCYDPIVSEEPITIYDLEFSGCNRVAC